MWACTEAEGDDGCTDPVETNLENSEIAKQKQASCMISSKQGNTPTLNLPDLHGHYKSERIVLKNFNMAESTLLCRRGDSGRTDLWIRYSLSVGQRDAGQQSQGQLGDVQVGLGHEGGQLLQDG